MDKTVAYLVNQIVFGKLTYQTIINSQDLNSKISDLQSKIEIYIDEKGLTIDKTV